MTILEALALFDSSRAFWKIGRGGCSIYLRNEVHMVRAAVRRKKGESLADMVIRCAELASKRLAFGWTPPPPKPRKPRKPEPDAANGRTARQIEQAARRARTLPFDLKRKAK